MPDAMFSLAGAVEQNCQGESRDYLMNACEMLPDEEHCYPGRAEDLWQPCGDDEFHCGDGQCIHGTKLCDRAADCKNAADELKW